MPSISKPQISHPGLARNALGLTRRDYEGAMSTLCAGCGHDSVTAAIVQAFWELDMPPHKVAKLSGIGCSGKTPAYFLGTAHGFNGVHGRMPALATGAAAANSGLTYIGISGDGDTLSIGFGQFAHAIRRNLNMLYVIENNGVNRAHLIEPKTSMAKPSTCGITLRPSRSRCALTGPRSSLSLRPTSAAPMDSRLVPSSARVTPISRLSKRTRMLPSCAGMALRVLAERLLAAEPFALPVSAAVSSRPAITALPGSWPAEASRT